MPTIDIPDKICPHCGGIRWCVFKKKDWRSAKLYNTENYYINYSCGNVSENGCARLKRLKYNPLKPRVKVTEEYTKKRVREYHARNKHKWISQTKEVQNLNKKKYYKTNPLYKKRINDHNTKCVETLSDSYVRKLIMTEDSSLRPIKLPQKLIDIKRKQLLLTRQLKQLQK